MRCHFFEKKRVKFRHSCDAIIRANNSNFTPKFFSGSSFTQNFVSNRIPLENIFVIRIEWLTTIFSLSEKNQNSFFRHSRDAVTWTKLTKIRLVDTHAMSFFEQKWPKLSLSAFTCCQFWPKFSLSTLTWCQSNLKRKWKAIGFSTLKWWQFLSNNDRNQSTKSTLTWCDYLCEIDKNSSCPHSSEVFFSANLIKIRFVDTQMLPKFGWKWPNSIYQQSHDILSD